MNRRWIIALTLSLLTAFGIEIAALTFQTSSAAGVALRVNEAATRFSLRKEKTEVLLAVENSATAPTNARVRLELIDPQDKVRATGMQEISFRPGPDVAALPLTKTGSRDFDQKELIWYRLRYQISPLDASGKETAAVSGLISLSEITPDIFYLRVSAPEEVGRELKYPIRVRALHPLTGRAVGGVNVQAQMSYEQGDKERELKASGVTNANGEALLEFKLPEQLRADEAELKVTARRDGFYQEANENVDFLYPNQILVSTDKPLYQPGQTLHVRVLGLDQNSRAWAGVDGTLKVRDPEGSYIFRAGFRTSRFGVASVDWPISDNARLGEYHIETWLGEESPRNAPGGVSFKISRYDLPNFVVNVKPDRGYYLAGQNAEVEVRADYLFGQPVRRGRVRVVRETERRWNYHEQKWETEEGEKYEGTLDDEGRFVARINLAEEHKDFKPGSWSRFRDLRYAAYLTDQTTGRTEQRRFDLRITRDPIHVYLIQRGATHEDLPLQFYVSAFYADGTPAQCEVAINQLPDDEDGDDEENETQARQKALSEDFRQPLLTVRTSRYGLAKVPALAVRRTEDQEKLRVRLTARDEQGRSGLHIHDYWEHASTAVRVETDKALYRAGEPVTARITSSAPNINLTVDLIRGGRLLATRTLQANGGRAEITFPFNQEFHDGLMVVAYPAFGESSDVYNSMGWAKVLYPRDRELKLDVQLGQTSYRPGEEARAELRVRMPDGRPSESALGVVVFDKAIEERARTDQEFRGRGFGFYDCFRGLLGEGDSLAGITRKDLDRLDLSKPLPEGLELVAEVLLNQQYYGYYRPHFFGGEEFRTDAGEVFSRAVSSQLGPVKSALESQYGLKSVYPTDEATLRRQMLLAEVDFDELRDPWGTPFRVKFSVETVNDVFELLSAGPDKRFGTADDFTALRKSWQYFSHRAGAIARTVENYHARTGGFIHDRETLRRELLLCEGVDIDALRDRWDQPYQFAFATEGTNFSIRITSGGPNGHFESEQERRWHESDDFQVSACLIDYTTETKALINRALTTHFNQTKLLPQSESDLRDALSRAGVDFDRLRDGWGNPYYATFKTTSQYYDRVTMLNRAQYGEKPKPKTEVTPVTQQVVHITIRSGGADGKVGTYDDFDVTVFSRLVGEQSAQQIAEKVVTQSKPKTVSYSGDGGAIAGKVTDATGAIVANATVTAKHLASEASWEIKTNAEGSYLLSGLAPGVYEVRFDALGFKSTVIGGVAVYSSKLTKVDATLDVGTVSETVTVTAAAPVLMTTSAAVASVVESRSVTSSPAQIATPRLREYFPETLLWQPLLETDRQGRAQLNFKLADNITTWKLSVVGSTVDGEIGIAEKEFRAFQPFFAEHDPPKVLTEGDEIALPVVLRNYLDKAQTVNAEIKPESWFELLGPARRRVEVKAGDAGQVIFDFRTTASVREGKQRVTAFGSDASDAIEKAVSIHPDGEEITQTTSDVFGNAAAVNISIPDDAIKGSARAELKIYPNLMAHALEGIEGILQRPYGCAEQTISSTYPNIMVLRYLEGRQENLTGPMKKVVEKARRYTQAGYDRLLGYRAENGGFRYWGQGETDLALTAYALRFLNDASDFVEVDEGVIESARRFLINQQQLDGRWLPRYWSKDEDARRTALNTAFITRVLAMEKAGKVTGEKAFAAALRRALDYLSKRVEEIDEPYLIASYALAATDAGERADAAKAVAKLRTLAREEAGTNYWNLESNTPFYGWGLAGRIETTALVVKALKADGAARRQGDAAESDGLMNRGLLFLLRNKDRYGIWLSTQATINVLDTLISLNEAEKANGDQAEIIVNGRRVCTVAMPPGDQLSNPITADLSNVLSRGNNHIEIRRTGNVARASVQVVEAHYVPWKQGAVAQHENFRLRGSGVLRLSVNYDRPEAKIGDEVTCNVVAERIGHSGYGMMLAEIGLPPGADVDRASLEKAVKESGWDLNHYDVLPDRVIVYLWPRAGGTKFSFTFRPRYGIRALTAASVLYDYYNPEARAVIAPTRFVVR